MSDEATDREEFYSAYVEALASVIGHADREKPLGDYCRGLLTTCERKSVEPLAAITAPGRTAAQRQSLLHFVGNGGCLSIAIARRLPPCPCCARHRDLRPVALNL